MPRVGLARKGGPLDPPDEADLSPDHVSQQPSFAAPPGPFPCQVQGAGLDLVTIQ